MPRPMIYAEGMKVMIKNTHTTTHISRWSRGQLREKVYERHTNAVRGMVQHGRHQQDLADAKRNRLVEFERFFVQRRSKVHERGIHDVDGQEQQHGQAADTVENPRPLAKAPLILDALFERQTEVVG